MSSLVGQPWFWPAFLVVVGLPVALLVLNEVSGTLARRGSAYAKPVALLRNWVLPACAAYLLLHQLDDAGLSPTWSKVAATVFGFLVMLMLLSGANAALFGDARTGSWRERLPGIFVDLGRLVLIILGIGLLLSWVWGANVGGLVTAVGVTSIVIGLAVQNAVGPVISGLLLLFEQPFRIGDWLDTKFGKGRVVEVNWRAVHIDTANGVQVVPNAALAGDAFVNLSRTISPFYNAKSTFTFSSDDPPGEVKRALLGVAESLPAKLQGLSPSVSALGASAYRVSVPVASPADEGSCNALLLHRVWYAAQRAGLHLDDANSRSQEKNDYLDRHVRSIAESLGLDDEAIATMRAAARWMPYAEGEVIQHVNSIPAAVGFITEGTVGLFAAAEDGRHLPLGEISIGDYIGGTALTRQRMPVGVTAVTDTTIVEVSRDAMSEVVQRDHRLARQIGDDIEIRRRAAREALDEAAHAAR